jgi:hypothetical protein
METNHEAKTKLSYPIASVVSKLVPDGFDPHNLAESFAVESIDFTHFR